MVLLEDAFAGFVQWQDGTPPTFRCRFDSGIPHSICDDMVQKVVEIEETTIYVGDKLVVMKKEVQTVRFLPDKPKDQAHLPCKHAMHPQRPVLESKDPAILRPDNSFGVKKLAEPKGEYSQDGNLGVFSC